MMQKTTNIFWAYRTLILMLIILISGVMAISYGWQCFATITERPGLWGTMHNHYNLSMRQYAAYNFIIAIAAVGLMLLQTNSLIKKDQRKFTRAMWKFGLFLGLLVLAEIYLQTRFIPKG